MKFYGLSLQGSQPPCEAETTHSSHWFSLTSLSNEAVWTLGKKRETQRPRIQMQLCRVEGTTGRTQLPAVSWAATK